MHQRKGMLEVTDSTLCVMTAFLTFPGRKASRWAIKEMQYDKPQQARPCVSLSSFKTALKDKVLKCCTLPEKKIILHAECFKYRKTIARMVQKLMCSYIWKWAVCTQAKQVVKGHQYFKKILPNQFKDLKLQYNFLVCHINVKFFFFCLCRDKTGHEVYYHNFFSL